jgi:hypothetical protein
VSLGDKHPDVSDEPNIWLATFPATSRERRSALVVTALILVITAVTAPIADTQLPRLDGFIPTLASIIFVTNLITAALLFAQFSIAYSYALLVLASGYLFVALIVIPFALSFPGAYAPKGLLGADLQTPAWLYIFWHLGFSLAVCGYVLLMKANGSKNVTHGSKLSGLLWSVAVVIGLVCGLTWSTTTGIRFFPPQLTDGTHFSTYASYCCLKHCSDCARTRITVDSSTCCAGSMAACRALCADVRTFFDWLAR